MAATRHVRPLLHVVDAVHIGPGRPGQQFGREERTGGGNFDAAEIIRDDATTFFASLTGAAGFATGFASIGVGVGVAASGGRAGTRAGAGRAAFCRSGVSVITVGITSSIVIAISPPEIRESTKALITRLCEIVDTSAYLFVTTAFAKR